MDHLQSLVRKLRDWFHPKTILEHRRFLKWFWINIAFILAIIIAKFSFHGEIHATTYVIVGLVLTIYFSASLYLGYLLWNNKLGDNRHINMAVEIMPMCGMVGTIIGFLLAFAGSASDVQARVLGASTGLLSTLIAVVCTIILMTQRHFLIHEE